MRRAALLLAATLALVACGRRAAPDPGGLLPEDSQLLNNAAEMLDNGGIANGDG